MEKSIRYKELGAFLKTRRAKISPQEVGLPVSSRRRTPGLRREEIATLAGVSLTWYTWLEQGREIQVSNQVVESLGMVLKLDTEEMEYLHNLTLTVNDSIDDKNNQELKVSTYIQHMIDALPYSPALILDKYYNVIAWNRAEELLYGSVLQKNQVQWNLLAEMFANSEFQKTFPDWDMIAHLMVARFRRNFGRNIDDPKFRRIVEQLSKKFPEFVKQWETNDVMADEAHSKVIIHPQNGKLQFEETCVLDAENPEIKIYIYTPDAPTLKYVNSLLKSRPQ